MPSPLNVSMKLLSGNSSWNKSYSQQCKASQMPTEVEHKT